MKPTPGLKNKIIVVLVIIFFVVLNLTGFSKEVKNFFYLISSPIQKTLWRAGDRVSDFLGAISKMKNSKKENEELKLKIQELTSEISALKELKKENETLREALGIGLEKEFKLALAQILGKDITQDTFLINKGSRDGISKGHPVVTQQKILVGKISEVYENFSKVMLISNKNSSFDAKIPETLHQNPEGERVPYGAGKFGAGQAEIYGVVKGKGNLKLLFDLVPKEKEIKEGDFIVTTFLGGVFPEGLLVGEIAKVKKLDVEPFQQAEIKPAFDIRELENLFIITGFK